jgi:GT2 family glycosyltransferase
METNTGYATACNAGVREVDSAYYLIINSDTEIHSDIITPLIAAMERYPSAGIVGPRLEYTGGKFQLSWGYDLSIPVEFIERMRQKQGKRGRGFLYERRIRESASDRKVEWLIGAVLFVRGEAFKAVGGFDEGYFFYFEEVDLAARVRQAGYDVMYIPDATVVHYGGGSQSGYNPVLSHSYRAGQLRYYARFRTRISFYLLKIYLSTVFGIRWLTEKNRRAHHAHTLRYIRKFRYASVRSHDQETHETDGRQKTLSRQ